MRSKSLEKRKKRVEIQILKTFDQLDYKFSKKLNRKVPTLKGRLLNKLNSMTKLLVLFILISSATAAQSTFVEKYNHVTVINKETELTEVDVKIKVSVVFNYKGTQNVLIRYKSSDYQPLLLTSIDSSPTSFYMDDGTYVQTMYFRDAGYTIVTLYLTSQLLILDTDKYIYYFNK